MKLRTGILLILLAQMAHGSEWFEGENLLTKFVPEDSWVAFEKIEPGFKSRMWKNKSDARDIYVVSMLGNYKKSLAEFRELQDAPGKDKCAAFESDVLGGHEVNGYPRLIWQTRCTRKDGSIASILVLAIDGKDQLYFLQKIWGYDPDVVETQEWRGRFEAVSVCDTRVEAHPCPDGFSKVAPVKNEAE